MINHHPINLIDIQLLLMDIDGSAGRKDASDETDPGVIDIEGQLGPAREKKKYINTYHNKKNGKVSNR